SEITSDSLGALDDLREVGTDGLILDECTKHVLGPASERKQLILVRGAVLGNVRESGHLFNRRDALFGEGTLCARADAEEGRTFVLDRFGSARFLIFTSLASRTEFAVRILICGIGKAVQCAILGGESTHVTLTRCKSKRRVGVRAAIIDL